MKSATSQRKPRAVFVLTPWAYEQIYGPEQRTAIAELVEVDGKDIALTFLTNHLE